MRLDIGIVVILFKIKFHYVCKDFNACVSQIVLLLLLCLHYLFYLVTAADLNYVNKVVH